MSADHDIVMMTRYAVRVICALTVPGAKARGVLGGIY